MNKYIKCPKCKKQTVLILNNAWTCFNFQSELGCGYQSEVRTAIFL